MTSEFNADLTRVLERMLCLEQSYEGDLERLETSLSKIVEASSIVLEKNVTSDSQKMNKTGFQETKVTQVVKTFTSSEYTVLKGYVNERFHSVE